MGRRTLFFIGIWLLACATPSTSGAFLGGCWGPPTSPTTEAFLSASSVVVGEITYAALPMTVLDASSDGRSIEYSYTLQRFQIRVRETLYGKPIGGVVLADMEGFNHEEYYPSRLAVGAKAIVFLRDRRSPLGDVCTIGETVRIGDYDGPEVDAHRRIAEIFRLSDIDEQVRATVAGCCNSNREFQRWCIDMLTLERYPIQRRLGKQEACDAALQCVFSQRHDFPTLMQLDAIIAEHPLYGKSDRRYETLWSAAPLFVPPSRRDDDGSFDDAFDNFCYWIATSFPDRADDSLSRMTRLAQDRTAHGDVRSRALGALCRMMEGTSATAQAEAFDFLEAAVADPENGRAAAIAVTEIAAEELPNLPRMEALRLLADRKIALFRDVDAAKNGAAP